MIQEQWEVIEDFPDYSISNMGEVINHRNGKPRGVRVNNTGVLIVNLQRGDIRSSRSVSALVAQYFMEPEGQYDTTPIHLNGDKTDCRVTNMMLRPRWFAIAFHQQFENEIHRFHQPIICLDTDEIFETPRDAAMMYGLIERDIIMGVINNEPVYPGAYEFAQLDDRFDED